LLVWIGQTTSKEDAEVREGLRHWVQEYSIPTVPALEAGAAVSVSQGLNQ